MCGLIFTVSKRGKHTGKRVFDLYKKQAHRGRKGFGYLAIEDGVLKGVKRSTTEDGIKKFLMNDKSEMILFHHRAPTSTPNTLRTTHPIFVSNGELKFDYYIEHNGVISNDTFLKKKHDELGYLYTTEYIEKSVGLYSDGHEEMFEYGDSKFNDSESLAIEVARYIEKLDNKVNITGSAAFTGIQLYKGTNKVANVFWGHNDGRDMCRTESGKWFIISSETGKEVEAMSIWFMNPNTMEIQKEELNVDKGYKRTVGYHAGANDNDRNPVDHTLVNAYYEAEDIKAANSDFKYFSCSGLVDFGAVKKTVWVPNQFLGKNISSRKLLSEYVLELPSPDVKTEDLGFDDVEAGYVRVEYEYERLEELAMKYARKQKQVRLQEKMFEEKRINKRLLDKTVSTLYDEMIEIEEQAVTLGVPAEEMANIFDIAEQLVDSE
jgi:predicted glutamine amidotransferase